MNYIKVPTILQSILYIKIAFSIKALNNKLFLLKMCILNYIEKYRFGKINENVIIISLTVPFHISLKFHRTTTYIPMFIKCLIPIDMENEGANKNGLLIKCWFLLRVAEK